MVSNVAGFLPDSSPISIKYMSREGVRVLFSRGLSVFVVPDFYLLRDCCGSHIMQQYRVK
ncbi:hypothetical protein PORCRE_1387 [Porphyromonas crevioricanis JCM 15906]|uniref:Uncharacterized protein n=1 Tax=Porphyromonas crevioricanis JCM 15906 TaxID=1305617 RepID=T1CPC8_9PORP|nr:hypothetical protein PORCRE_1387 [Porphyromonas crevioricanis JCM 15906]